MVVPKGHTSNIKMAVYNPQLPIVATASNDKTVKLWDIASGKLINTFSGHVGGVNHIKFSPNGRILAAASDTLIYLWNVMNGQLMAKYSTTYKPVSNFFFSSASDRFIYQKTKNSFSIHNLNTGHLISRHTVPGVQITSGIFNASTNELFTVVDQTKIYRQTIDKDSTIQWVATCKNEVLRLVISPGMLNAITANGEIYAWNRELQKIHAYTLGFVPDKIGCNADGKLIAISDTLNTIHLFSIEKQQIEQSILSGLPKIESLTLGNTGTMIAASCITGIRVWKASGEMINQFSAHSKDVENIEFNANDTKFLSCGRDIYALEWNFTDKPVNVFSGYSRDITNIAYSTNNMHFATTSNDSLVRIWSNRNTKVVSTFNGNQPGMDLLNVAPIHNYLISSGSNYVAWLWNLTTGDSITSLAGHTWKITDAEFSPDESYLLTASLDETIKLWKIPEGKLVKSFQSKKWGIQSVSFNPSSSMVVSASTDNRIRLWNTSNGKLIKKLKKFHYRWADVQFLSNSDTVAALASTGIIYIIDTRKNCILDSLNSSLDLAANMTLSEDKKWIYTSYNGTITVRDVAHRSIKAILPGINEGRLNIQVNPEGTRLIAVPSGKVSNDFHCRLWDLTTFSTISDFNSHALPIRVAKFSPDHKFIMTSSSDHTLKLWSAETGKELLSLLILPHNSWVTTTPEGLFDATPSAMSLIHFVVNTPSDTVQPWKIIGLDQLKHRYYQPSLWAIVTGFSSETLRNVPAIDSVQPPPSFTIAAVSDSILIHFTSDTTQIGKTSLFIDDIEVCEDIRATKHSTSNSRFSIDMNEYLSILNPDSANTIKVIAYNREGYLSSKPQTCVYTYAPTEKGTGNKKKKNTSSKQVSMYAIVVGTSDYSGTSIDLKYASKDATDFAHALKISGGCLFGSEQTHVVLLTTDKGTRTNSPEKDTIRKYAEWVAKNAHPEDIVLVYFSGHGINYGGQDGDFYYITKDASAVSQGYLNDPFVKSKYAISSTELTLWMNKISARKKVLIFDACASGKAAEVMLANVKEVPSSQIRAFERMKDRTGFYILAGSASDAVSYETSIYGQGLLTYSLLKAMKGAYLRRDGGDEFVDVGMLLQYAVDEVPRLAKGIGGIQQPLFRSPSEQRSFDIGCMSAETKSQIDIAEPKPIFCATTFIDQKLKRDALKISEKVNNILRETPIKSTNSLYLFTDGIGYPNAYMISGTYETNDQSVKIEFVISQNDTLVGEPITVTALKSELNLVVKTIIQQAILAINKKNKS